MKLETKFRKICLMATSGNFNKLRFLFLNVKFISDAFKYKSKKNCFEFTSKTRIQKNSNTEEHILKNELKRR